MIVEIGTFRRIVELPANARELGDLLGTIGKVESSREIAGGKVTAVGLRVPAGELVYISARYLEEVDEEEIPENAKRPDGDPEHEEYGEEPLF